MTFNIAIINGPNLNLIGQREPAMYGHQDFDSFFIVLQSKYPNVHFDLYQSNVEGEIVNYIQQSLHNLDALIINPAAFTHTSVAIRDALALVHCPIAEVHLSKISSREPFRHNSLTRPFCFTFIEGLGLKSYEFAVLRILELLSLK